MKKRIIFVAMILLIFTSVAQAASTDPQWINIKIGKTLNEGDAVSISADTGLGIFNANNELMVPLNETNIKVTNLGGEVNILGYQWDTELSQAQVRTVVNENLGTSLMDKLVDGPYKKQPTVMSSQTQLTAKQYLKPMEGSDLLKINDKPYRGSVYFSSKDDKIFVVNHIGMEDYLKGVVAREIGSSSPEEAQKAQAICARSFAASNMTKYINNGYNLDDTPNSQVYGGVSAEAESTNRAIDATRGIYGRYQGQIASLIFGSTTGGISESAKNIWGGDNLPYLESIDDPYSLHAPHANWSFEISLAELSQRLKGSEYEVGEIKSIEIVETTPAHRVKKIVFNGTDGTAEMSGDRFRMLLGSMKVMSTWFDVEILEDEVIVSGHGFGHGVGMSQYGAMEMAKQGFDYRAILNHYYPQVIIDE